MKNLCVMLSWTWLGLSLCGCALQLPRDPSARLEADLIEVQDLEPSLRLDIRYATADNFCGRAVYTQARAFLQRPAAQALIAAHRQLAEQGFGIVVYDGYRPWRITKLFWDITPPAKRNFVADPKKGSRHNRGCAVDIGLFNLKTGAYLDMPTTYDDFSEKAHAEYNGPDLSEQQRANRELLKSVMQQHGFSVYSYEWWHFDFREWAQYPILDVPFEDL